MSRKMDRKTARKLFLRKTEKMSRKMDRKTARKMFFKENC